MAGLYLNSYPLTCSGDIRLYKFAANDRHRRDIQDDAGVSVWVRGRDVYAYRQPADRDAEVIASALAPVDDLGLFVIREAVVEHCRTQGFDAWIGRAGEIHVAGVIAPNDEDRFRIEHVLHIRVSQEDYVDADAMLTARHRTAWRCIDPLSHPDIAARARRQPATRLRGDGPYRGRVERIVGHAAVLRCGADEVEVAAADYTLAVNAAFIAAWRGSSVLRRVRVTTGELTMSGKRNRHGIEDRFKLIGDAVRRLGGTVPVAEDGRIEIDAMPIQIRLEESP